MEEEVGGVDELAALRRGWSSRPQGGRSLAQYADAAEEIEVVLTVFVAQVDAVAADEETGLRS